MNSKTFNFQQIKDLFADPTFVPFLFIWALHGIGGWGISFVLPTVILDLGITNSAYSQLMTMVSHTPDLNFLQQALSNNSLISLPTL